MVSYCSSEYLLIGFLYLSTCFVVNYAQPEDTIRPELTIPQGTLLGVISRTRNGRNYSSFLGIPYAQPPIANLRFANPVAASGWHGIMDNGIDRSECPQRASKELIGDEDCLYLNVYTRQHPIGTNSPSYPVMVYIHGGSFREGSKTSTFVGAEFLLDRDVVLVVPNYRLGPLGFLSTGDEVASGNWGLKDNVLALKWVQDNVKYFGGDPGQVTIFGESSGAVSVHLLTLSDTTIGLFHRFITQSGSALATWAHRPRAAYSKRAFELGGFVGCYNETSDSLISCLRTINFTKILNTDKNFMVWRNFPDMLWGPTDEPDIEGAFLTDTPTNLFAAGRIRDIPWFCGVDRDEGLLYSSEFYTNEKMLDEFIENFDTLLPVILSWEYQPDSGAAWTRAVKSFYFNDDFTSNRSLLRANITSLFGDAFIVYPLRAALERHNALAVNRQYFYLFNYRGTLSYTFLMNGGTGNNGVSHADELIYLFPTEQLFHNFNHSLSKSDQRIVDAMVELWTSFAINGIPTASVLGGSRTCEPFSSADGYLRIGNGSDVGLELQHSFLPEKMRFWANINAVAKPLSDASSSPNLGYRSFTDQIRRSGTFRFFWRWTIVVQ